MVQWGVRAIPFGTTPETLSLNGTKELTDGYGADVYLDATGHPSAVPQGLNLLGKLGRYVEYGVFGAPVTVDWTIISDVKELDVLEKSWPRDLPHGWNIILRGRTRRGNN